MKAEHDTIAGNDTDDDFDWEEVAVPVESVQQSTGVLDLTVEDGPSNVPQQHLEITILARPKVNDVDKQRRAAIQAERINRLNCHKVHTVALLLNAQTRNRWLNDPLLHARLMSLVPMKLQTGFNIHKSRVPEAPMRGRMFEAAMTRLVDWWCETFNVRPTGHIKSRTYEEVQEKVLEKLARKNDRKGKRRARDDDDDDEQELYGHGEVVRSEKSLMKHALQRRGCRDTSAQLFTALCRALGIPTRLVVSLQSVPWQKNGGKSKSPAKKPPKKAKEPMNEEDEDDADMEEVSIPSSPAPNGTGQGRAFPGSGQQLNGQNITPLSDKARGKQKASPVITLRKNRGRKLGSAPAVKRERSPDPLRTPPIFWTEVFSRADARWLPVDPVRGIVNKRKVFDPTAAANIAPHTKIRNRMVYVLALEEDGYARDVTARYAAEYGAKVSKLQQGGRGKKEWWEQVMAMVRRPYRLNRDDLEDEELHVNQMTEQMPSTMSGFKDHPLYVLARHLKRDEVIHPLVELGKFRGEPVYPRSSVISLKTAENWMRQGRKVREGCQPMKWVKQRAVTVNKKRAIEIALAERQERAGANDQGEGFSSEKDIMQGLYAMSQTELYVPDPIVNGKIPKNDFGNIDLYVPSMLPPGGVHIPYKGAWKIARELGFDYAEAVTSFEFRKRRAIPVITGIVIAKDNEEALLEAYWAAEQDAEEKRRTKRQEQVIKRWQRLVQGLRIRQRLQEQYSDKNAKPIEITVAVEANDQSAGGFMGAADDVVQPYYLPKNLHPVLQAPPSAGGSTKGPTSVEDKAGRVNDVALPAPVTVATGAGTIEVDSLEEVSIPSLETGQVTPPSGAPKTMRELAEDAERRRMEYADGASDSADPAQQRASVTTDRTTPTIEPARSNGRATRSGRGGTTAHASVASGSGSRVGGKTAAPPVMLKLPATPSRKSRKRARAEDSDSDNAHLAESDADADIATDSDSGSDAPTGGGRGRGRRGRSRTKRARKSDSGKAGASDGRKGRRSTQSLPTVPKSDRVLRTRVPKTAEKVQEEKEQERAYRRALAE